MTPDQREALRAICKLWAGHRIYLVGATSLVVLGKLAQDRVTLDLDLAVDVLLDELRRTMTTAADWRPDPTQEQRWLHRGQTPVDLLAIGAAHLNGGELVWPDTGARMNLVGFDLLSANSRAMTEPGFDDVYVPSPAVVAVLKVAAWLDRPDERRRDLQDLAHLFDRYVEPMDDRMFVGETARRGIFGEDASIFWLGERHRRAGKGSRSGPGRRLPLAASRPRTIPGRAGATLARGRGRRRSAPSLAAPGERAGGGEHGRRVVERPRSAEVERGPDCSVR